MQVLFDLLNGFFLGQFHSEIGQASRLTSLPPEARCLDYFRLLKGMPERENLSAYDIFEAKSALQIRATINPFWPASYSIQSQEVFF
jgi:hypothetical protein